MSYLYVTLTAQFGSRFYSGYKRKQDELPGFVLAFGALI